MTAIAEPHRPHPSSFRDPAGFIFRSEEGEVLRQVNRVGLDDYHLLMDSGLFRDLTRVGLLIEHEECPTDDSDGPKAPLVLKPRQLEFLSYPYEWAFSALKDAALLTLDIQRRALRHGMSLKDASAFNVQFDGSSPVFIDTLSFERLREGRPWPGYAQFCRHFLAPLALMARRDISLGKLLAVHLDGIPTRLASRSLPGWTWLMPGMLIHLHLLAKAEGWRGETDHADKRGVKPNKLLSRRALEGMVDSLQAAVSTLSWQPHHTQWADYYATHNYSPAEFDCKSRLVAEFLKVVQPRKVWDLGANTGRFSRMAGEKGALVLSFDIDPGCVELAYLDGKKRQDRRILPLLADLSNPTPALGWAGTERMSLAERGPADMVMALALIHHLAISHNIPLPSIADYLSTLGKWVIVEFVPKSDPQAARLLRSRDDIFDSYTLERFEAALAEKFSLRRKAPVEGSGRTLYLLESLPS